MSECEKPVIIAADNPKIRDRLKAVVEKEGYQPTILKHARDLWRMPPTDHPILLETGDDVALMCQLVYELYRIYAPDMAPWIIGFLSTDAMNRNPSIGLWSIRDAAALVALLPSDDRQLDMWIVSALRRIQRSQSVPDDAD
jgi:hypothetical protein